MTNGISRRRFLETTSLVATGALLGSSAQAQQKAKYTRYNVTSPGGQRALRSYAKGVAAMLKLPASDPRNWFRNAFVHLLDCPHGNWWFYVWHRGYIGYFEETIRNLSGDPSFALPYWDWTELPRIPEGMFDGPLTPRDSAFEPYTGNMAKFNSFIKPAMERFWSTLTPGQVTQLNRRGYTSFDKMWNDVNGYDPEKEYAIAGNIAFATTCAARYLTRDNPALDPKTAKTVSPSTVLSGLAPREFYNSDISKSFTSSKTPSHNTPPSGATEFSILEGMPHNKVHNYIGGVGPLDYGPYGNMTNNLSPVDPIFFLHHGNMDRLWDVWTRKQQRARLPWLPEGAEWEQFSKEAFLFYVDGQGRYVGPTVAGDFVNMSRFDYDYEPGFGENFTPPTLLTASDVPQFKAKVAKNVGSVAIPEATVEKHLQADSVPSLIAKISIPRPEASHSGNREFDVIVGAPDDVTSVDADSPYYAGTIAFFGNMSHMAGMEGMPMNATFTIPLPQTAASFAAAAKGISIRVVPTSGKGKSPKLNSVVIESR